MVPGPGELIWRYFPYLNPAREFLHSFRSVLTSELPLTILAFFFQVLEVRIYCGRHLSMKCWKIFYLSLQVEMNLCWLPQGVWNRIPAIQKKSHKPLSLLYLSNGRPPTHPSCSSWGKINISIIQMGSDEFIHCLSLSGSEKLLLPLHPPFVLIGQESTAGRADTRRAKLKQCHLGAAPDISSCLL